MTDDRQIAAAIRAVQSGQVEFLTGTVVGTSIDPALTQVRLDSDQSGSLVSNPITIPSIIGIVPRTARVSVAVVPPSGMLVIGTITSTNQFGETVAAQSLALRQHNSFWINPLVYLANDTWNNPIDSDPTFLGVTVQIQSGGGGSGGTTQTATGSGGSTTGSAGGQGGGYLEIFVRAASLTATVAVTVGAGGTAGTAPAGTGGTGGVSSFGAYGSIPGGNGGAGGGQQVGAQTTQRGGNGSQSATVAGGALTIDYQQGDDGGTGFRYQGGATVGLIMPGYGGGSRMAGITALPNRSGGQIAPTSGYGFGGGASGRGADGDTIGAGGGAAGAQGLVIVREVYRM